MKRRFVIIFLMLFSLFLFSSCGEEEIPKTAFSISTSFNIEGVTEAESVTISVKERDTGKKAKIKIIPGEEKVVEMVSGTYFISDVSSGTKRVSITLNEQYFTVNKANKIISLSVKEESVKNFAEWFFYNNSVYLLCLVGCSVFLGVSKWKETKRERMR